MASLNSFLLYTFAKNIRLGSDVQSFLKRYQILSIIYVHLTLLLVNLGYCIGVGIALGYLDVGIFTPISAFFIPISVFLLRKGKVEHVAGILVPYMHTLNFIAGTYAGRPVVALYTLMLFPHFTFFISSSKKVRNLNFALCAIQIVHHTYKIKQIFEFGLSEEQSLQINTLIVVAYVCMGSICVGCVVEKSVETSLWRMAETNQDNSEKLTQEVVQAAAAKDAFVSSLSHEIRNPLNSLAASIDFLLETVKDSESRNILKNAKLSGEVLLNLVNNVLDAAKLRSEKMEIAAIETNFDTIINKVFTINSENLKRTQITAKAEIDKRLPKTLFIDPSRFLQIFMNLMSNALKFTSQGGSIQILVKWRPTHSRKEDLLAPIDPKLLQRLNKGGGQGDFRRQNRSPERSPVHRRPNDNDFSIERTGSDIFMEFSRDEETQHRNNLSCLKEFKVRGLEDLMNADHLYSQHEPWSICRVSLDQGHEEASEIRQRGSRSTESSALLKRSPNKSMSMNMNRSQEPPENGFLQVQITDTGRGIAKEDISRLFGMFIQVHGTAGMTYHGTGLGLWICKQLCNKMGGDIKVYSEVNKGTSFVFYVPVDNERMYDSVRGRGQFTNSTRDTVNVLIADDYVHNRELHKLLLEREGVAVSLAADGKEALQRYKDKGDGYYDFILMDVQMPEMDGFTAAKEIRAWEQENGWNQVHLYFVSGEYYNEDEVLASLRRSQGQNVYMNGVFSLRKPIDIQIIRRVLQKYKKTS